MTLQIALLAAAAIASFFGTYAYRSFALRHSVVAAVNFRSLHSRKVPRGGGIVIAGIFSIAILAAWKLDAVPNWLIISVGAGGAGASLVGLADDIYEIPAPRKLFAQISLALWAFATAFEPVYAPLFGTTGAAMQLALAAGCLFVSVWFINMYNFIDGIDGMAVGGVVYICLAAIAALSIDGGDHYLGYAFALLAASSLGFLPFNLPPASIFMGDAGSIFLGYCLASLAMASVALGQMSIWTWIAILGYFVSDTTVTGVYRLLFVKRWYGVHRSHAYQNLARILDNHAKVTYGVALYNATWALPLALWSAMHREAGPIAAALAVGPATLWALRFGPRFSSQ